MLASRNIAVKIRLLLLSLFFKSSGLYWEKRYSAGGNSGKGSYDKFAAFKSQILNKFVLSHNIKTVVEIGCGNGHQVKLFDFPFYVGLDVSEKAIDSCKQIFIDDKRKSFYLVSEFKDNTFELAISLDVIYHLVENDVFTSYMNKLFSLSGKYVVIYSSNTNKQAIWQAPHVLHRKFTDWIDAHIPGWKLVKEIKNKHPTGNFHRGHTADLFVYEKI